MTKLEQCLVEQSTRATNLQTITDPRIWWLVAHGLEDWVHEELMLRLEGQGE